MSIDVQGNFPLSANMLAILIFFAILSPAYSDLQPDSCNVPIDLAFLIDASGSIGEKFSKVIMFAEKIVDSFDIHEDGTHVAAVTFSNTAQIAFGFNDMTHAKRTKNNVMQQLNDMQVTHGKTRIDLALVKATKQIFTEKAGMRRDKPKIAILITDGKLTRTAGRPLRPPLVELNEASFFLQKLGVYVFSLGIGDQLDDLELLDIASDQSAVFNASDVDKLIMTVMNLTDKTCKVCTKPIDFHFAVDTSMNFEEFQSSLNLIKSIGNKLAISELGSHISGSVFGYEAELVFNLSKGVTYEGFIGSLKNVLYSRNSEASLDNLLHLVLSRVFTLSGHSRANVPKVLVVFVSKLCPTCSKNVPYFVNELERISVKTIFVPVNDALGLERTLRLSQKVVVAKPPLISKEWDNGFAFNMTQEICNVQKAGHCPLLPSTNVNCAIFNDTCHNDDNMCPGNKKCCQGRCGKKCVAPVHECIVPLDLALAIDGTVSPDDQTTKEFIASLVNYFPIRASGTHVALLTFSNYTVIQQAFTAARSSESFLRKINLKAHNSTHVDLKNLFQVANENIFSFNGGMRRSSPRVFVVMIRGKLKNLDDPGLFREAKNLNENDVKTIIINTEESTDAAILRKLTHNSKSYFSLNSKDALLAPEFQEELVQLACSRKSRLTKCEKKFDFYCKIGRDLCEKDMDCPGLQECVSNGCKKVCTVCPRGCPGKLDLMIVLQNSERVSEIEFNETKKVAKTLLEYFDIDHREGARVSVMVYGDSAQILVQPTEEQQTLREIYQQMDEIQYLGLGFPRMDRVFHLAATSRFSLSKLNRQANKVLILFNNGNSHNTSERLEAASWLLHEQKTLTGNGASRNKFRVMSVSRGKHVNIDGLSNFVTPPLQENAFIAANFADMYNMLGELSETACQFSAGQFVEPPHLVPGDPGPPGPKGSAEETSGEKGYPGRKGRTGREGKKGEKGVKGSKGDGGFQGIIGGGPYSWMHFIQGTPVQGPEHGTILDLRKGPPGQMGDEGVTGPVGMKGMKGVEGFKGKDGAPGRMGIHGVTGEGGDPGKYGAKGKHGNAGLSGKKGEQGVVGSMGYIGAPGPFGFKGERGRSGMKGEFGETGENGQKGYPGEKGQQGNRGELGFEGVQGEMGSTGPPGSRGVLGGRGNQGLPGKQGPPGYKGEAGIPGKQGFKGERGSVGGIGYKGQRGDDGPVGPEGFAGIKGLVGEEGRKGFRGDKGQIGFRGSAGPPGKIGLPGKRGSTGLRGFMGSIGKKGSRGPMGSLGVSGLKGEFGNAGLVGPRGLNGKQGVRGRPGYPGLNGEQGGIGEMGFHGGDGVPGKNGLSGPKGSLGSIGPTGGIGEKGEKGYKGPDGSRGVKGEDGTMGQTGEMGTTGKPGTNGVNGRDGTNGAQGHQGAQGISGGSGLVGYHGDAGNMGERGVPGFNGTKGEQGLKGVSGYTGPLGSPGKTGGRGKPGVPGPLGQFGVEGPSGVAGAPGRKGKKGSQGSGGSRGESGISGRKGKKGSPGHAGEMGRKGATGNIGESGDEARGGRRGEIGPIGLPGKSGPKGTIGVSGKPGNIGAKGNKGEKGQNGVQGNNGKDGGTGQKGSAGLQGRAGPQGTGGNTGSNGRRGIKGGPGRKGAQGDVGKPRNLGPHGPQGLRGMQGSQGSPGQQGFQGDRGDIGETGSAGITGSQGSVGKPGIPGPDGADGAIGLQGPIGKMGLSGKPGLSGPNGVSGAVGFPGKHGRKGPAGDPGESGQNGASGEMGKPGVDGIPGRNGFRGSDGDKGIHGKLGTSGLPGKSGPTGPSGRPGKIGRLGKKGFQGLNGEQGDSGKRGSPGSKGAEGIHGENGIDGLPGTPGLLGKNGRKGIKGLQGAPGKIGFTGHVGLHGDLGERGKEGKKGIEGLKGRKGENGRKGDKGSRGAAGVDGSKGGRGKTGADGFPGYEGAKGRMGLMGLSGSKGERGLRGDPGPPGVRGNYGVPGVKGERGITGGVGGKGPEGRSGWRGIRGNQGVSGRSGRPGTPGPPGVPGPPGPAGPPGLLTSRNLQESLHRYYKMSDRVLKPSLDLIELWERVSFITMERYDIGSRKHPAVSCRHLFTINATRMSGNYWIDPTEGFYHDAVLVYCNRHETCIYPRHSQVENDTWDVRKNDQTTWAYEDLLLEKQGIIYVGDYTQIKMLHLFSEKCRQNVTVHCKDAHNQLAIKTNTETIFNARNSSQLNVHTRIVEDSCQITGGQWGKRVFEFTSRNLEEFPILDVGLRRLVNNHRVEFGIEVGPICFY